MVKLKTTKSLQPSGLAIMDRPTLFLPPYAIRWIYLLLVKLEIKNATPTFKGMCL
jgi:hypothetical protein